MSPGNWPLSLRSEQRRSFFKVMLRLSRQAEAIKGPSAQRQRRGRAGSAVVVAGSRSSLPCFPGGGPIHLSVSSRLILALRLGLPYTGHAHGGCRNLTPRSPSVCFSCVYPRTTVEDSVLDARMDGLGSTVRGSAAPPIADYVGS